MGGIPDDTGLKAMNIPGTHDSASRDFQSYHIVGGAPIQQSELPFVAEWTSTFSFYAYVTNRKTLTLFSTDVTTTSPSPQPHAHDLLMTIP